VRVGDEAGIRHEVCINRQSVFESEAHDGQAQRHGSGFGEEFRDGGSESVDVVGAGVQHNVSGFPELLQHVTLGRDTVEDPSAALKGMRAAALLEAADQHIVTGVEEEDAVSDSASAEGTERRPDVSEQALATDIDDHCQPRDGLGRVRNDFRERPQHLRGKIFDDVPAVVLQGV